MKTVCKLLTLVAFVSLLASCSAEELDIDQQNEIEDVSALGGNTTDQLDRDRD